jgi:methyltransferase (TIGR00027 family)
VRGLPSLTADAVCLARALEALRPPEARVVDDPYAHLFLQPPTRALLSLAARAPAVRELIRTALPTDLAATITARHRWIDDRLLDALPETDQVLILGAGFDSRAWRLADRIGDRPVLEVDHPATARRKAACATKVGLTPPNAMTVDLAQEPLADVLSRSPLRAQTRTFIVWEGVSMYLREEAVRATLTALADWAGPGSRIAFDVWTPTRRPLLATGVAASRLGLVLIGEPLLFSIQPDEVGALLADTGWQIRGCEKVADVAQRWGARTVDVLAVVEGRRIA